MSSFDLPDGTHTVEIVIADNHGILRGKSIPAGRWGAVRDDGVALSGAALIWGARCELRDRTPVGGMETGYPDITVVPIAGTERPVPWRPGTVQVLGEVRGPDGERHELDARNALRGVLDAWTDLGFEVKLALEMEFYLLDPQTRRPRGTEVNCYAVHDDPELAAVVTRIRTELVEFGVPIEASNPEYAPGQFEVNLRYESALDAVDNGVRFRSAVKEIATQHGLLATFMGKPFDELSGCGMHVHQSLWREGRNAFRDDSAPLGLSETGLQYVAGLYRGLRELTLFGSPTVNDYKRRQDNSFCPTTVAWGTDNRTVAIRAITAGGSTRIEQRDAAGDCNPYLAVAGQLTAGLVGVREGLTPPAPTLGNAYEETRDLRLPVDVREAAALLENSSIAAHLPKPLVDVFVDTCRYEHAEITSRVSDIERDRYLGVF